MKYPSTPYIWWSPTVGDYHIWDLDHIYNLDYIALEKMDGEQTNMLSNTFHARSQDSEKTGNAKLKQSRAWCKALWASIRYLIPNDMRICGENLFAMHSIYYDDLLSYFQVFNIWRDLTILNFDDTLRICSELNLTHVRVIDEFKWNTDRAVEICNSIDTEKSEGIVFRPKMAINTHDFSNYYFKWVRKDHIQTSDHWLYTPLVQNKLKGATRDFHNV
jgi:hypothetical protein